jgi:hypothetical protein
MNLVPSAKLEPCTKFNFLCVLSRSTRFWRSKANLGARIQEMLKKRIQASPWKWQRKIGAWELLQGPINTLSPSIWTKEEGEVRGIRSPFGYSHPFMGQKRRYKT